MKSHRTRDISEEEEEKQKASGREIINVPSTTITRTIQLKKIVPVHPSQPATSLYRRVCPLGVFCTFKQEILLVYATQSERTVVSTILNCFIIRVM